MKFLIRLLALCNNFGLRFLPRLSSLLVRERVRRSSSGLERSSLGRFPPPAVDGLELDRVLGRLGPGAGPGAGGGGIRSESEGTGAVASL